MSMSAFCLAIRDHLRDSGGVWYGEGFAKQMVEIASQGRPPAMAGDFFIGICDASWSVQQAEGLYEVYGVQVVVSLRGTQVAYDRWGPELLARPRTGLWDRVAAIRAQLHLDVNADDILNRSNLILDHQYGTSGQTVNGFVECPQLQDGGTSQERGGDWWSSKSDELRAGVSQTIRLAAAGRVQHIESMT